MPGRLNVYPPDSAAMVRLLEDGTTYRIGRSSECEMRIDHPSVSRFHAELERRDSLWQLHDTGSKNGLRVDGHLVLQAEFPKSGWFSIGDVHCSFELLDAAQAVAHRIAGRSRRDISRALSSQLQPGVGISSLIQQTLDVVLQLSGLERGFVLYAPVGERLRVRASRGLRAVDLAGNHFAGSASAVERALARGKSVVCCDTTESPWLAVRPSVRLGEIRAIVCVPFSMNGQSTGAIYADSRKPGPPVTELDLELVENIAMHASTAIDAARIEDQAADNARTPAPAGTPAPLWDELRRNPALA